MDFRREGAGKVKIAREALTYMGPPALFNRFFSFDSC